MKPIPLSIVILAGNEAEHLRELLPTLKWAAEAVVIDDNSHDTTREIAKEFGARVVKRSLHGDYAAQRNAGLRAAGHDWVFFLDADERVPLKTVQEISKVVESGAPRDGYRIKRVDVLFGKKIRHGEAGNTWLMRLGKKDAGVWERPVHEVWKIANSGMLVHPIMHYSHGSLGQFLGAVARYAKVEALFRLRQRRLWSGWELVVYPVGKFLYTFFGSRVGGMAGGDW